jgi:hypothetical protein
MIRERRMFTSGYYFGFRQPRLQEQSPVNSAIKPSDLAVEFLRERCESADANVLHLCYSKTSEV